MASVNRNFYLAGFLLLLTLMLGVLACDKGYPTQPKAGLPTDHTSKLSYAYHKTGLYIPESKCTPCHGDSKLKGAVSNSIATPSCIQCHSNIWAGLINHTILKTGPDGKAYHKEGMYAPDANCVQCHGQDLKGGSFRNTTTPSCYLCHTTTIWDWKKTHTLYLTGPDGKGYHNPTDLHNPQVYCTPCHGQNLKGGTFNGSPTKSCYQCHKTSIWDWRSTHTVHLTGVDGSGYHQPGYNNPSTNCVTCHGTDLKGGTSGKSCYQCHKTAVWNWRSTHTKLLTGADGSGYHQPGYNNPSLNCVSCHGSDLKGGTSGKSCYQCHKTAVWNWQSSHTALLTGIDGRGYHQPGYNSPLTNCVSCHGSDLKGGASGKSCYQCHKTAIWDWRSSHTTLLTGVDGRGYHKPGYNSPLTNCVSCHGSDLKGGTSGKSCYQCHKTAVWDWRSSHIVNISNHWHKPGFFSPTTNCVQCHGSDLKGGTSGVSCYNSSCHSTAVWNWQSSHATNIGGYKHQAGFFNPSTNCVKCHGSDLKGGLSGKSCYQCHTAVWDWRSTHTRSREGVPHMSGSNSTCTKCHGTDFLGGISGKSCYGSGCHRTGQPPGGN